MTVSLSKSHEVDVDPNSLLNRPPDPIKPGYAFNGWYVSDSIPWDFDNDTVNSDLVLYAVWEPSPKIDNTVYHNLIFDTSGGQSIPSQLVANDSPGTKPDDPVKPGSIFWYWSTAPKGGTQFDFSAPIISDTTLYAQYFVEVSFFDGDVWLNAWQIQENTLASEPVPLVDHYGFDGWFTKEGKLWDGIDWPPEVSKIRL